MVIVQQNKLKKVDKLTEPVLSSWFNVGLSCSTRVLISLLMSLTTLGKMKVSRSKIHSSKLYILKI